MNDTSEAKHLVRYTLIVGTMLDDVGFRHLLSSYVDDLRDRLPGETFDDDTPNTVLDDVIPRLDPVASARTGGAVFDALAEYSRRAWRLELAMTTSDFGLLEKRDGPYRFDRAQYHLGRRVVTAQVVSKHPGSCSYRRSRHLPLEWARAHAEQWIEVLPDPLWWSVNDAPEALGVALADESLVEVSRRLDDAGFSTESLGLYLTTLESVYQPDETLPQ
jgi:hypothetical protein